MRQRQIMTLVLGGMLGLTSVVWAGMRIITTPAGCHLTFKNTGMYRTCVSCVKSRHKFKLDLRNSWMCK